MVWFRCNPRPVNVLVVQKQQKNWTYFISNQYPTASWCTRLNREEIRLSDINRLNFPRYPLEAIQTKSCIGETPTVNKIWVLFYGQPDTKNFHLFLVPLLPYRRVYSKYNEPCGTSGYICSHKIREISEVRTIKSFDTLDWRIHFPSQLYLAVACFTERWLWSLGRHWSDIVQRFFDCTSSFLEILSSLTTWSSRYTRFENCAANIG